MGYNQILNVKVILRTNALSDNIGFCQCASLISDALGYSFRISNNKDEKLLKFTLRKYSFKNILYVLYLLIETRYNFI